MEVWPRLFALAYDPFVSLAERAGLAALRAEQVGRAHGRVLELGAGTGLNLRHYDPAAVESLTLVEPDAHMLRRLRARLASSGIPGSVVVAGAEALPFPDDSFDSAVATLVLCTVPDPAAGLAEVARVLRPGGELLFLEHVAAAQGSRAAVWQERLHGPWHAFARGCHTNRDTVALIERSPLALREVRSERWRRMPPIVGPLVLGSAAA